MLPRKELVPRSSVVCFVSTTVSVKYVCQIALDLHAFFSAFDTYFSNQGIRNFTNSKIHALVCMNPFGFVLLVVDQCSICSYTCY